MVESVFKMAGKKLQGAKPDEIKAKSIETLQQASRLLDEKASQDALAVKTWMREFGQRVAEAAPEGGWMGFGGMQVSQSSQVFDPGSILVGLRGHRYGGVEWPRSRAVRQVGAGLARRVVGATLTRNAGLRRRQRRETEHCSQRLGIHETRTAGSASLPPPQPQMPTAR
jgi:hypothetical protein